MTGSKKQIEWAESIKENAMSIVLRIDVEDIFSKIESGEKSNKKFNGEWITKAQYTQAQNALIRNIETQENASWFIDNRDFYAVPGLSLSTLQYAISLIENDSEEKSEKLIKIVRKSNKDIVLERIAAIDIEKLTASTDIESRKAKFVKFHSKIVEYVEENDEVWFELVIEKIRNSADDRKIVTLGRRLLEIENSKKQEKQYLLSLPTCIHRDASR